MEAISLKCPHCGAVLTVPDTYVGRTSNCGRCRRVVTIKPPAGATSGDDNRGRPATNWYDVLMNAALAALVILLLGMLARYLI